jgi:hypothetical protein
MLASVLLTLLVTGVHAQGGPAVASASCIVRDPELRGEYVGGCVNGYAEGEGTARGVGVQAAVYMGSFRNGYKQGRGVKFYANGDVYSGEWANDQRSGFGVYSFGPRSPWAGDRYSGSWLLDQRHGKGVYTWAFGDQYDGMWNLGQQAGLPTPAQVQRTRLLERLMPKLRESAPNVCSIMTEGAGPGRVARGSIVEFAEDRIRVRISSFGSGAAAQQPAPAASLRWEHAALWSPC